MPALSNLAATPEVVGRARLTPVQLCDPAVMAIVHAGAEDRIAHLLRHLTEGGGSHNFVIFEVGRCRYVQFATSCGSAVMYGEASSGRYCAQNCTCSPTAVERARLLRLGWRPPTRKFLNFYRYWPFITQADRQAIAEIALATVDVFGWHGEPLKAQLHLDW